MAGFESVDLDQATARAWTQLRDRLVERVVRLLSDCFSGPVLLRLATTGTNVIDRRSEADVDDPRTASSAWATLPK
jgi:hypothetical protein